MTVVVDLGLALICFAGRCHPVLWGGDTPVGEFKMIERRVLSSGYGGRVLQFYVKNNEVFSIHRVWKEKPEEMREAKLASETVSDNMITNGCINVSDKVFEELLSCCSEELLVVKK